MRIIVRKFLLSIAQFIYLWDTSCLCNRTESCSNWLLFMLAGTSFCLCSVEQRQTEVTTYLKSKQLLLFTFAQQSWWKEMDCQRTKQSTATGEPQSLFWTASLRLHELCMQFIMMKQQWCIRVVPTELFQCLINSEHSMRGGNVCAVISHRRSRLSKDNHKIRNNQVWIFMKLIQGIHPMLFLCWTSVEDGGPKLKRHWINASCLLELLNPLTSRPGCMPGSRYTGVGVLFFVIWSWNC